MARRCQAWLPAIFDTKLPCQGRAGHKFHFHRMLVGPNVYKLVRWPSKKWLKLHPNVLRRRNLWGKNQMKLTPMKNMLPTDAESEKRRAEMWRKVLRGRP